MASNPKTLDRTTVYMTVSIAALTALGTAVIKDWLPAFAEHVWERVFDEKIVRVSLRRKGDFPIANASLRLMSADDDAGKGALEAISDQDGRAVFRDVGSSALFLKVVYSEGGELFTYRRDFAVLSFPYVLEVNGDDGWTTVALAAKSGTATQVDDLSVAEVTEAYKKAPWLKIAIAEIGVKEFESPNVNPRISEYHQSTDKLSGKTQALPWGCSFLSWVFSQAKTPENPKSGRCADYAAFGTQLGEPRVGALVILSRKGVPELISGFAGFYIKSNADTVTILGGNIHNEVAVSDFPMSIVTAYRWPI